MTHRPDDTERFTAAELNRLDYEMRDAARQQAQRALDAHNRHARTHVVLVLVLIGSVGLVATLGALLFAYAHGGRPW